MEEAQFTGISGCTGGLDHYFSPYEDMPMGFKCPRCQCSIIQYNRRYSLYYYKCNNCFYKWYQEPPSLEWVKMTDRRPPEGEAVLLFNQWKDPSCMVGYWRKCDPRVDPVGVWSGFLEGGLPFNCITHWMPLPINPIYGSPVWVRENEPELSDAVSAVCSECGKRKIKFEFHTTIDRPLCLDCYEGRSLSGAK